MRLKVLAISDTHLGEETSLLSFPRGLQHLWSTLFEQIGQGEKLEIEEVLLLGDIPDRTLSSTSQISAHTHAFAMMLGSAANVKKVVYIPGNHDHTLWTDYRRISSGGADTYGITGPAGDLIVEQGKRLDVNNSADEILSIFLGYPIGWAWWEIEKQENLDFAVANPVYVRQIDGRTYVFTHGTHFRPEVTSPKWVRTAFRLLDVLQLDWLAGLEFERIRDLKQATSLEDLERLVAPFVDSLWPSSKNNPTSQSDELWYLYTLLRGGLADRRAIPPESEVFSREQLPQVPRDHIGQLTDNGAPLDRSLDLWQEFFFPHMVRYLDDHGFPRDELTFVYGDTHNGGWGELTPETGEQVRVYNCGSWVMSASGAQSHPACHLFAVDESGEEYLFDVSFKGVRVGDDDLLSLAAQDVEHHYRQVSYQARALGELLYQARETLGR